MSHAQRGNLPKLVQCVQWTEFMNLLIENLTADMCKLGRQNMK